MRDDPGRIEILDVLARAAYVLRRYPLALGGTALLFSALGQGTILACFALLNPRNAQALAFSPTTLVFINVAATVVLTMLACLYMGTVSLLLAGVHFDRVIGVLDALRALLRYGRWLILPGFGLGVILCLLSIPLARHIVAVDVRQAGMALPRLDMTVYFVYAFLSLVGFVAFFRLSYVFPSMVLEECSLWDAFRRSNEVSRGFEAPLLAVVGLAWLVSDLLSRVVASVLGLWLSAPLVDLSMAVLGVFIAMYPLVAFFELYFDIMMRRRDFLVPAVVGDLGVVAEERPQQPVVEDKGPLPRVSELRGLKPRPKVWTLQEPTPVRRLPPRKPVTAASEEQAPVDVQDTRPAEEAAPGEATEPSAEKTPQGEVAAPSPTLVAGPDTALGREHVPSQEAPGGAEQVTPRVGEGEAATEAGAEQGSQAPGETEQPPSATEATETGTETHRLEVAEEEATPAVDAPAAEEGAGEQAPPEAPEPTRPVVDITAYLGVPMLWPVSPRPAGEGSEETQPAAVETNPPEPAEREVAEPQPPSGEEAEVQLEAPLVHEEQQVPPADMPVLPEPDRETEAVTGEPERQPSPLLPGECPLSESEDTVEMVLQPAAAEVVPEAEASVESSEAEALVESSVEAEALVESSVEAAAAAPLTIPAADELVLAEEPVTASSPSGPVPDARALAAEVLSRRVPVAVQPLPARDARLLFRRPGPPSVSAWRSVLRRGEQYLQHKDARARLEEPVMAVRE